MLNSDQHASLLFRGETYQRWKSYRVGYVGLKRVSQKAKQKSSFWFGQRMLHLHQKVIIRFEFETKP